MARGLNKLTDTAVKSTRLPPGRHSDGGGLYLNVTPTGSKSWLFMWVVGGQAPRDGARCLPERGARKGPDHCR